MKVSLINPNVTNNEIYGATDVSSLSKSILDNGLLEPLVITREGNLLSGHRRLEAIKSLGWEPKVDFEKGLKETIKFYKNEIK